MKLWHRMRCRTNSHMPTPHRVGWDGEHYRGNCRHCGVSIIRLEHGKWRGFADDAQNLQPMGFGAALKGRRGSAQEPDRTRS